MGGDEPKTMKHNQEVRDLIVGSLYARAEEIAAKAIKNAHPPHRRLTEGLDRLVTSRWFGLPLMLALLTLVFWITIFVAQYPSDFLAQKFFYLENLLTLIFTKFESPPWLHGILVLGLYRTLAWVVAVMLPPMAIFFPLFTLLEDFGYLPRIAFNLDHFFQKAGAHGKQALTMAMGFGCNAAGVISARIIDSPRERLLAILTNNFMPCNGRFPLLIAMGSFAAAAPGTQRQSLPAAFTVLAAVLLAVFATFLACKLLAMTLLRGEPSFFALELPPYRRPQIRQVLARSFLDRTLFVLKRAVLVAAPAGIIIWLLANTTSGGEPLITRLARFFDPFGRAMGLDGAIVLAFILGLPANEIVIPVLLMSYLGRGALLELGGMAAVHNLLVQQGWNVLTALNFLVFTIFHWPCGTTLLTIRKETGSWLWAFFAALLPTFLGISLCILLTNLVSVFL